MTEELITKSNGQPSSMFSNNNSDLEDGEIVDENVDDGIYDDSGDSDDTAKASNNTTILDNSHQETTSSKQTNGKENNIRRNNESNSSKFSSIDEASFKSKRRIRLRGGHRWKRKRSSSFDHQASGKPAKFSGKVAVNGTSSNGTLDILDITQWLYDESFDQVELLDQAEYNLECLDFETLMEILGCSAPTFNFEEVITDDEKQKIMLRIIKIMRHVTNGSDPLRNRRFARLKRRTRERQNSQSSNSNSAPLSAPSPPPMPPVPPSAPGSSAGKPFRKQICKFYLDGKCHKGDDCTYSHDCVVPKRRELCKFYLQGFCGKGDDCLYMHAEFPCKFFHTNVECYSKEKCRFSHNPLTEETKEILRNYLDSGTLPDDPKPFRARGPPPGPPGSSAIPPGPPSVPIGPPGGVEISPGEWGPCESSPCPPGPSPMAEQDIPGSDEADYDHYFNYETEVILSRPRPVLLGGIPSKLKSSYDTWRWQQDLKESEKEYKGGRKNLFQIDEGLVIAKEPALEDNEDEVEAMIRDYYNDTLDNDEYFEMMAIKEIEEHQRLNKDVPAPVFQLTRELPMLDEEEKKLIEASAHDEDLRFSKPGVMPGGPFGGPFAEVPPAFDSPSSKPPEEVEVTPTDVDNFLRQVRNNANNQAAKDSTEPIAPEFRDPRLKRLKGNASGASSTGQQPTSTLPPLFVDNSPSAATSSAAKPYLKVCNPNLSLEYKAIEMAGSVIDYSAYYDAYQTEGSILKQDPRLKKFFTYFPVPEANLRSSSRAAKKTEETTTKGYSLASFSKPVGSGSSTLNSSSSSSSSSSSNTITTTTTTTTTTITTNTTTASTTITSSSSSISEKSSNCSAFGMLTSSTATTGQSVSSSTMAVSRDPRRDPRMKAKTTTISTTLDKTDKNSIDSIDSFNESISSIGSNVSSSSNDDRLSTSTTSATTTVTSITTSVPSTAIAVNIPSYAMAAQPSIFAIETTTTSVTETEEKSNSFASSSLKIKTNWNESNGIDSDDEADKMEIDLERINDSDDDDDEDDEDDNKLVIATSETEDNKDSDTISNESFSFLQI